MKLKLHTDDYVTAMGAVGLIRLCEQADRYQWEGHGQTYYEYRDDHILVDSSVLQYLPDWYFRSLLMQYSVASREEKRLRYLGTKNRFQTPKDQMKLLREAINDKRKRLAKYFPDEAEYLELEQCLEEVKKLKADQDGEALVALRDRYLELLRTPEFDEKLTFNVIRSNVLYKNFFGQTSFLQKSLSHYNLEQHVEKMEQDFIAPLVYDIGLHQILQDKEQSAEERYKALIDYLDQATESIYKRWRRELKKLDPSQVDHYFQDELHCVFEEEWLATDNFEEKTFAPLGLSSKLYNFAWELKDQSVPISSWIRLIMLLSPIGVTPYTRLANGQFETFYTFVYSDGTPRTLFEDNEALKTLEQNESFERLIPKIVQRETHKAKQEIKANIQLFEFYSDYDIKKTVLHYYHVPQYMLVYLSEKAKLEFIKDRDLRDTFLRLALENIDPIRSIWSHLEKTARGQASATAAYYALNERLKILNAKGEKRVATKTNQWYVRAMFEEGKKIRDSLHSRAEERKERTDYVSGGEKRAAGIAYRLLNAAKAGNKKQFLDTTLRLYLQVNERVPMLLLNVLHEEKIDFDSLSGAFITGLLYDKRKENEPEESLENEEGVMNDE